MSDAHLPGMQTRASAMRYCTSLLYIWDLASLYIIDKKRAVCKQFLKNTPHFTAIAPSSAASQKVSSNQRSGVLFSELSKKRFEPSSQGVIFDPTNMVSVLVLRPAVHVLRV
mmetsp:Transcript_34903/g.56486  ORF Transcript_34903/g.56486 Transcript_34903/m.56486 type:complete len:112 (+) Transcript_34903:251-586(+)